VKPYELTQKEMDDVWADKDRTDAHIIYDFRIAHAAQKKLLEYIVKIACPLCVDSLLKDFKIRR
jgi:hypothetical protein